MFFILLALLPVCQYVPRCEQCGLDKDLRVKCTQCAAPYECTQIEIHIQKTKILCRQCRLDLLNAANAARRDLWFYLFYNVEQCSVDQTRTVFKKQSFSFWVVFFCFSLSAVCAAYRERAAFCFRSYGGAYLVGGRRRCRWVSCRVAVSARVVVRRGWRMDRRRRGVQRGPMYRPYKMRVDMRLKKRVGVFKVCLITT